MERQIANPDTNEKTLSGLVRILRKHWPLLLVAGFSTLGYNFMNLLQPLLFKSLFENIFQTRSMAQLNLLILGAFGLYLFKAVFQYIQIYSVNLVNAKVVLDIQNELYYKILRLRVVYFDRGRSGEFFSRMFNDIGMVSNELSLLILNTVNSALTLVGAIIWIFFKSWTLALLTFVVIPLISLLIRKSSKNMGRATSRYQEELANLSAFFSEALSGIKTLKAFAREKEELEKFFKKNQEVFWRKLDMVKVWATHRPLAELSASLAIILISWYGGYLVIKGLMTPGDILAYWGYVAISVTPATILSNSVVQWKKILTALSKVFDIINVKEEEPNGDIVVDDIKGKIEFDNVWLSYEDSENYEIKGMSFSIEPGERVAFIGPTGAGKTSIISLLLRFYEPTKGKILIDGVDLRDYDLGALRKRIGVMLQEPFIFRGTVRENIAYPRPDASMEEIIEAAKKAQIHDEIIKLPQGYDTLIGESGATLSGGQRQRIALARLFLLDPRILLLDEPTSALDIRTEEKLKHAFRELMRNRTTILITHRLSLLEDMDRIFVVVDGRIVKEINRRSYQELQEILKDISLTFS